MTYAWPCLLSKNCVDPATRYHGHLLLSHIIAKFAIHKRIVLQVFHSLLKAHAVEARNVVRQALEILTPSMPGRVFFKEHGILEIVCIYFHQFFQRSYGRWEYHAYPLDEENNS